MTQIAMLEGRTLVEHYVSRAADDTNQIDGNVYRGRVQNVLPGMEAAFVDIGIPKNAVLYRGDVRYDKDDIEGGSSSQPRIEDVLKAGQTILCQVTKNPIGAKGARLTQEVSLPGRFAVLVPNSSAFGISKRLGDNERRRLRRIIDEVKPSGHGMIVRTAAEGVSADELQRDVTSLLEQWNTIEAEAKRSDAPGPALPGARAGGAHPARGAQRRVPGRRHRRPGALRAGPRLRPAVSPELADRVEYYDTEAEGLPIFERYHVHEQLHKALDRKVWLPSGGSLIIERTEALTVIDVNTGKNVGKTNLEETVFRNNLEAAEEVAHQLRLRDIGGIIVIDFIDMEVQGHGGAGSNAGIGRGGGGGGSFVYTGSMSSPTLLIAAGGGGGAEDSGSGHGGSATTTATAGDGGGNGGVAGTEGGGGGGGTVNGASGAGGGGLLSNGGNGTTEAVGGQGLVNGGAGGAGDATSGSGGFGGGGGAGGGRGGGGGGGYNGGGGGSGDDAAGGGGSSFFAITATNTSGTSGANSGNGQVTITPLVATLGFSPVPGLSFPGTQPMQTLSRPLTLTVMNTGTGPLNVSGLTFAGDEPEDFILSLTAAWVRSRRAGAARSGSASRRKARERGARRFRSQATTRAARRACRCRAPAARCRRVPPATTAPTVRTARMVRSSWSSATR